MLKNDLIELLNLIEGNPEVVLWNGIVGDYQHVGDVVPAELVKETLTTFLEDTRLRGCIEHKDWDYKLPEQEVAELQEIYHKEVEWGIGRYVSEEDIKAGMFELKPVIYIEPKVRGIETFDRHGTINY